MREKVSEVFGFEIKMIEQLLVFKNVFVFQWEWIQFLIIRIRKDFD